MRTDLNAQGLGGRGPQQPPLKAGIGWQSGPYIQTPNLNPPPTSHLLIHLLSFDFYQKLWIHSRPRFSQHVLASASLNPHLPRIGQTPSSSIPSHWTPTYLTHLFPRWLEYNLQSGSLASMVNPAIPCLQEATHTAHTHHSPSKNPAPTILPITAATPLHCLGQETKCSAEVC